MHNKGPDTPNNKMSYSIESPMVRHHETDTKFVFLAHLVQKLEAKTYFLRPYIMVAILWRPYWISWKLAIQKMFICMPLINL